MTASIDKDWKAEETKYLNTTLLVVYRKILETIFQPVWIFKRDEGEGPWPRTLGFAQT